MKKFLSPVLLSAAVLLTMGCNSDYNGQLDDLEARLELVFAQCVEYNEALKTVSDLATAIESKDFVTGITKIMDQLDPSKEIGYTINFINHEPITITYGENGKIPYVNSIKGADNQYYWTVQYDDGEQTLIKDSDGNPVSCIGKVPFITIRDKKWFITFDNVNYTELGPADGKDADTIFKSFDVSDKNKVVITLSDGTVMELPTMLAYKDLVLEITQLNSTVKGQKALVEAAIDKVTYIKSVNDIISDGASIGKCIVLSNGKSCNIYDVKRSNVPNILSKFDPADGNYYWAASFGDNPIKWITVGGTRIKSVGEDALVPTISMALDTVSGQYCWTEQWGEAEPTFIRDSAGLVVAAIDTAESAIFQWYDNSSDYYVQLKTFDGDVYTLPKQYAVDVRTTIEIKPNTSTFLPYTVYGDEKNLTTVTVLTQGGFKVTDYGDCRFLIDAPETFSSGTGQIVLIFNICGLGTRTVVKTIDVINPEAEETK